MNAFIKWPNGHTTRVLVKDFILSDMKKEVNIAPINLEDPTPFTEEELEELYGVP